MKYMIIATGVLGAIVLQNPMTKAETACEKPLPCPKVTIEEVTDFLDQGVLAKDGVTWRLVPQNLEPVSRTKVADSDGTCSYEDKQKVLRFKLVPKNQPQPQK